MTDKDEISKVRQLISTLTVKSTDKNAKAHANELHTLTKVSGRCSCFQNETTSQRNGMRADNGDSMPATKV